MKKIAEAVELALVIMKKHGLSDWGLVLTHSKNVFGMCDFGNREISLSMYLIKTRGKKELKDTILHEVAHALRGEVFHDREWKNIALKLGAKPYSKYRAD